MSAKKGKDSSAEEIQLDALDVAELEEIGIDTTTPAVKKKSAQPAGQRKTREELVLEAAKALAEAEGIDFGGKLSEIAEDAIE